MKLTLIFSKISARSPRAIVRILGLLTALALIIVIIVFSRGKLHLHTLQNVLSQAHLPDILMAFGAMVLAFLCRGESWYGLLAKALPQHPSRLQTLRALLVGMAGSTVAPGRIGEAARSWLITRRIDNSAQTLSRVVGTVLAQTLFNIVALISLGIVVLTGINFHSHSQALYLLPLAPILLIGGLLTIPRVLRMLAGEGEGRAARAARWMALRVRDIRQGLEPLLHPSGLLHGALPQWLGWIFQLISCWALLRVIGIHHHLWVEASAVLLAVNVSAIFPVTPSNIGVFQAACIAALLPFGIGAGRGLTYGIILQAVEVICALGLGIPSLLYEGFSWSQLRRGGLSGGASAVGD